MRYPAACTSGSEPHVRVHIVACLIHRKGSVFDRCSAMVRALRALDEILSRLANMLLIIQLHPSLEQDSCTATMSSDDFLEEALPWSYYPSNSVHLQLRHNTHIPHISRLPPELLSTIFLYYQHFTRTAELETHGWSKHPYLWIKITHVCHQWREIALGLCELWTDVWCTSKFEITEVCVRRAERMRLRFRMERYVGRGVDEKFVRLVLENLDRTEAAQIRVTVGDGSESKNATVQTITAPCRYLHRLEIIANAWPAPLMTTHDTFLSILTKDAFPALTHLDLYSCRPLWHKDTFPRTLRELYVRYTGTLVFADSEVRLGRSVLDIATAVAELTSLEALTLSHVLPELAADTNPSSDSNLFMLPRLTYMHIKCRPDAPFAATYFLGRFELPQLRRLSVLCTPTGNFTSASVARLATTFRPYFATICRNRASDRRPITHARMDSTYVAFEDMFIPATVPSTTSSTNITANNLNDDVHSSLNFKPGFVFSLDTVDTPRLLGWISPFLLSLHALNITSAHIYIESGFVAQWLEVLRCLPTIMHLRMTRSLFLPRPSGGQSDFFEEIVVSGLNDREVMPKLREVVLGNVYQRKGDGSQEQEQKESGSSSDSLAREDRDGEDTGPDTVETGPFVKQLRDAFLRREKEFGMVRVEKLTFCNA